MGERLAETLASAESAPSGDPSADATVSAGAVVGDAMPAELANPIGEWPFALRYDAGELLGRGGMGEVRGYVDKLIGREVAVKSLASDTGTEGSATRFLREACIQGQLEHPAIVPVHDVGAAPDGRPCFTMRRIRGLTLERVLHGLRTGDAGVSARFSRRKLLTELGNVCLAIDFAHSRGVVHRDLKPSNIMLGDFGEVYVLDWGVAKATGITDAPSSMRAARDPGTSGRVSIASGSHTEHGAVLGTVGYMAPEQILKGADAVDRRADVYALGAILFECLTLVPLHTGASPTQVFASNRDGADARPSSRAPEREVPPELEELCLRATAHDPNDRLPTARALYEALERHLDGDRDVERRRELAAEHVSRAHAAVARAELAADDSVDRAAALRDAARALALDPDNVDAQSVLGRLLLEPPKVVPAAVDEETTASLEQASLAQLRGAAVGYASYLALVPFFVWAGVRNWLLVGFIIVTALALAAHSWVAGRAPRLRRIDLQLAIAGNALMLALMSRMFGPFMLIPGLATAATLAFIGYAPLVSPTYSIVLGCLAVFGPAFLEWTGVIAPTYFFGNGDMHVISPMIELHPWPTRMLLVVGAASVVAAPAALAAAVRRVHVETHRRLHLFAWHLRQVLPNATPPSRTRDTK